jgi:riboflavin kinase/FMN adenylyltransferase
VISLADLSPVAPALRKAFLAVGNFDGVHRGHANLLGRLRARADTHGAPAIALTFDPLPAAVLRPQSAPVPLTTIDRKVELLKAAGATEVGVFRTGPWLLGLTAREFFERVVLGQFDARGMVEGPTFGFGRDRGGDAQILSAWCAEAGLEFEIVAPTDVDGSIVSSTRIRRFLADGDPRAAARLLGRPYRLRGIVSHGAGRGAGLGFSTANLDEIDTQIPADGVYAGFASIAGRSTALPAAVHIGPNATFGEQLRKVEAHLLDFAGELYGQWIDIDFLERIRTTRKFAALDDLLTQIQADVARVRELTRHESCTSSGS